MQDVSTVQRARCHVNQDPQIHLKCQMKKAGECIFQILELIIIHIYLFVFRVGEAVENLHPVSIFFV